MLDTNLPDYVGHRPTWDQYEIDPGDVWVECLCCGCPIFPGDSAYLVDGEWYCSVDCAAEYDWEEHHLSLTEVHVEDCTFGRTDDYQVVDIYG